jgi:hypothetical protein
LIQRFPKSDDVWLIHRDMEPDDLGAASEETGLGG